MSRFYEVTIKVERIPVFKAAKVLAACQEEWTVEDDIQWCDARGSFLEQEDIERLTRNSRRLVTLQCTGQDNLCGGVSEKELSDRIAQAVWQACGSFVPVTVWTTNPDALPTDSYVYDRQVFRLMRKTHFAKGRPDGR
jgi:hypothetical protein